MLYYILNQDLEVLDMIELYSSMIWTNRFWDVGDFELYLPASPKTVQLFSDAIDNGYYIVGEKDLKHAMMPLKLDIETSRSDGNYISVKGYDLKYILNRRIVWEHPIVGGDIESELIALVDKNAINPENKDRVIPRLYISDERSGVDTIISGSLLGENLAVGIKNRCKLYGCGWDIELDMENRRMLFKVLKSTDRRDTVRFSNEMDNLLTTKLSKDNTQPRNIAYVNAKMSRYNEEERRYEPFDFSQIVTLSTVRGIPKGMDRYELYSDNNENYDSQQYSIYQYGYILRENAKKDLREARVRDEISGEVVSNVTYKLGVHYNIGDIVSVLNEYGMTFNARVTEVIISRAKNKDTMIPSFAIIDRAEEPDPILPEEVRTVKTAEGISYLTTSEGELMMLGKVYDSNREVYTEEGGQEDLYYAYLDDGEIKTAVRSVRTRFDPDYDFKLEEKSKWGG